MARWTRARVGAGALAALLGVGSAHMVYRSVKLLADAGRWAGLDSTQARRRAFGASYTDAVDAIRRGLPEDAWYLLFPSPHPDTGWEVWLRHDLAPRRAVLIEPRGGRRLRTAHGAAAPKRVRWAILPRDNGVPELVTREEALVRLKVRDRP